MKIYLICETSAAVVFCDRFSGIIFAHYDAKFRRHHQLCLSILKRFGFGQRVMETRILMEVEEMINKVREQQGRAFDPSQLTTSCVANILMNVLFGRRFDHSDPALQQLILDVHDGTANFSFALLLFPVLRFLPYFKNIIAEKLRIARSFSDFTGSNTASCKEVSSVICSHNAVVNSVALFDSMSRKLETYVGPVPAYFAAVRLTFDIINWHAITRTGGGQDTWCVNKVQSK